jgi:hypothetical protein
MLDCPSTFIFGTTPLATVGGGGGGDGGGDIRYQLKQDSCYLHIF